MTKLSVNLNKIALLRNSRDSDFPNLIDFANLCVDAGVHGLTIHPRPDQRHARYADVYNLAALVAEKNDIELNIEGNPTDKFLQVVLEARPTQCTLVPDDPNQLTSDHGWDINKHGERLKEIVGQLKEAGIRSSVFIDPDPEQIRLALGTDTDRIELYTESYARAFGGNNEQRIFEQFHEAAKVAQELEIGVNAGHDLNQENLAKFLTIHDILEVSIGHALTVESLLSGFEKTIKNYLTIMSPNY
ncbi:MAG: pyridoxine 5'-phosphate synthase [Gammaproteobacteria bacterium]|jgi:pyridoxine 5-phosphate synthase|nr:pyridoxine 5'-phosphate synthase [Gammaproteobacteria bacterium]